MLEILAGDVKRRATEEVLIVEPEFSEGNPLRMTEEPSRLVVAAGGFSEARAYPECDPEREAL
ncbi:MAG TPA: hypothetical protein VL853_07295 [Gemmatimonadales bacterium]|nr:hypothetical protein [Gemmatimonadales bacterium]